MLSCADRLPRGPSGQRKRSPDAQGYAGSGASPLTSTASPVSPVGSANTGGQASSTSGGQGSTTQPSPAAGPAQILPNPLSEGVTIESDSRINAVIVSATEDKLPFFERLIKELDTPSKLVQIDVTIIDVSASRLSELGIDWEIGPLEVISSISPSAGLAISGMTSAGTVDFASDVQALEQVGDARIVSQPSVLTFDSVEAVIDESETFYVEVSGSYAANLFEVQTGTLLRVTPRIVEDEDVRDIELYVDIRDGSVDDSSEVDGIPTVDESTLTTTALVADSQGLLLGGLYRTENNNVDEKVPLLGDLPVLGAAFRSRSIDQTTVVRLFLLTPRIVELGARTGDRIDLTSTSRGVVPLPSTEPAQGTARVHIAAPPQGVAHLQGVVAPQTEAPSQTQAPAQTAAPPQSPHGARRLVPPQSAAPGRVGASTVTSARPTVRRARVAGQPLALVPPAVAQSSTPALPGAPTAPCGPPSDGGAPRALTYDSAAQRLGCLSNLY
jgi:type II secretory pathway component GspD/PulD (secretin)